MDHPTRVEPPPIHAGQLSIEDRRPIWPTVVGIVCILYAAMSLTGTIAGLAMTKAVPTPAPGETPEPDAAMLSIFESTGWLAFSAISSTGLAILLLIAGIGLLSRRRWSISAGKIWSWLTIATTLAGTIFSIVMFDDLMAAAMSQSQPAPPFSPGGLKAIIIIGMALGFIFALILPVFLLLWFSRPRIRGHIAAWV